MCGIAGFYLRDPNFKIDREALLDSLLSSIDHRGKDATGFVAIGEDGDNEWQKASCDAETFIKYRRAVPETARVVLGHTRWATQGLPEFMENNHPIKRGPYYIIHNGHVSNDDELFKNAKRLAFGYVDSEAIAARLASMEDIARLNEVMEEIKGAAAVAAVDERDPASLVLARGSSSPLWVYNGRVIVIFASTKEAVTKAHKEQIGHISNRRLFEMNEGDQILWKGSEIHHSQFKFEQKKTWSWSNPATAYQPSNGSEKAWRQAEYAFLDDDDDQDMSCDSCNTPLRWNELTYRYSAKDQFTLGLCDECVELWDWNVIGEAIDAEYIDDDDEESKKVLREQLALDPGPMFEHDSPFVQEVSTYDDYAGANASILRQIGRRIAGI